MFSLSAYGQRFSRKLKEVESSRLLADELKVKSDQAITLLHSGKLKSALSTIREATRAAKALSSRKGSKGHFVVPFQEYAECLILLEIMSGSGKIPNRVEYASDEAYVLGLADSVGELNRAFLQALIGGRKKEADKFLSTAVKINDALRIVNYPDFVVPGLRRKKDVCRIIVNNMLQARARHEFMIVKEVK